MPAPLAAENQSRPASRGAGIRAALFAAACAAALASPSARAAQAVQFPAQSLIIPTQSSYQDPCGMVSTYGLVYSVLRANGGGNKAGNFQHPITIHWVFSDTKTSPNRCVPTNLDFVYNGNTKITPTANYLTGNWNDGCDITLVNSGGVPATLINNSATAPANDLSSWNTFDTTGQNDYLGANGQRLCGGCSELGPALAFPNYRQQTVQNDGNTNHASTNVTTLKYAGGAFVISAGDAAGFLDLLSGVAVVNDINGKPIDFSAFKSSGSNTCSVSVNGAGNAVFSPATGPVAADVHQVRVHRAQVPFTASDGASMNAQPAAIGLLQSVDHDYADESGVSVLTGDCRGGTGGCGGSTNDPITGQPIVGTPTGIKGTQLKFYLQSAGLNFAGAGGCPPDGYNNPVVNPYDSATANLCTGGVASYGQIYDNLDARDLASGLINATKSDGTARYQVVWAPHWEGRAWNGSKGIHITLGCDATCIANARAALVTFFEDTQHPHGFLGECATVGFLEGAVNSGEVSTYQSTCNPGYNGNNPSSTINGCFPNERYLGNTQGSQSLTCPTGSTSCSTSSTAMTAASIGLTHDINDVGKKLNNCSDPTSKTGSCIQFANPNSAFAQVGDYRWYSYSGGVSNYEPIPNVTAFTAGAQRLLYTIDNLNPATLSTNPTSMAVADNVTLIQRGNDKSKAQLVYLGGHNYTPDVAGTRIALNTVLALGLTVSHQESAFVGPTVFQNNGVGQVLVATYNKVTTSGAPQSWYAFDASVPQYWEFPYHSGYLHINAYGGLKAGDNTYNQGNLYDAVMPLPGARNVFTYLGGSVSTTDSKLPVSYRSAYGRGVAQIGWKPVSVEQGSLDSGSASFVDTVHIGPVLVPGSSTVTYAGMVGGTTGPDGVSDLQEALGLSIKATDLGDDNGASTAEQTSIVNKLKSTTELTNTRWLLQMIRGFCYSTTASTPYKPTDAQCQQGASKSFGDNNRAQLGGLVHSQPAVVPASTLVPDKPNGSTPVHRPTVAYVGGLDGQLHAFYMYSDGQDSGYSGPLTTLSNVNPSASSIFTTSYSSSFSIPSGCSASGGCGQELWAFIPPGQLPYLRTNAARVDSSPAVSDVFGDFDGTGIRTWHTVLVASAGGTNREIFALDITNPLQPVLLWDLVSTYDTALAYAPVQLQQDDTGQTSFAQAFNWQNRCRAADGSCKAAKYSLPPTADDGRTTSGLYNYAHLGASQSVSVGVLRRNNAPVYAAFIATNEPGGNGIYVFSIDLVTGAKLWEWNNPYDFASYKYTNPNKFASVGNSPPAGATIVSRSLDDQVNSVYVGDDEGSLWELDASDGINNTGYAVGLGCTDPAGACNYSLNQTYGYSTSLFGSADVPQPISTLPTLFKVRPDIPVASIFSPKYVSQVMLVFGTAGTDAAASVTLTPALTGAIHMMPAGVVYRDLAPDLNTGTQGPVNSAHAASKGVDYEAGLNKGGSGTAVFPQKVSVSGERVYGSVTADLITGKLYFATTNGSITDIDSRGSLTGNIYQLDTTAAGASTSQTKITSTIGGVGGTLGMAYDSNGQVMLVASTDHNLFTIKPTSGGLAASATKAVYTIDQKSSSASGFLGWLFRRSGREY